MAAKKSFKDLTDLEHLGVTGNVKQVMQVCYKAHYQAGSIIKGEIEMDAPLRSPNILETFNESGYHTEQVSYRPHGNEKHIYDDNRHSLKTIYFEDKDTITRITTSTYDDKGNYLESITAQADGTELWRRTSAYNDNNKRISEHTYNGSDQTLREYSLFSYTEKGDMLSHIQYDADGVIKYTYERKYDDNGYLIEDITEWSDPTMAKQSKRSVRKNNEHGDCIEHTVYNMDGTLRDVYTYSYQYDSEGKKIVAEREDFELYPKAPGETETFEYDDRGNWIKKTVCYKTVPKFMVEREIVYADDAPGKTLIHPLENKPEAGRAVQHIYKQEELSDEELRFLAESNTQADQFPLVRYYTLVYKEFPSVTTYNNAYIEVQHLLKRLKEDMNAQLLHTYSNAYNGYTPKFLRYTLNFSSYYGYMVHVHAISSEDADEYRIPSYMNDIDTYGSVLLGNVMLLKPSENYGHQDKYFEDEIERHLVACMLDKKPEKPVISIIEVADNNFTMREHAVNDNFVIKDLDINYGYGFQKFHNELIQRFSTGTKGLVLFHGEPGTGKTYYIRHLLRTMVSRKKEVIYMPPNMADHLVEPAFITFLTQTIKSRSREGSFCVLLIEDAEPLLARRQEGVRIQGITNLLNMSDGILNDLLNLQIICTFNVSVKKLDSALLRPGRLIARKEFKPLSVIDANRLAQRIGVKHHFTAPATLGEIYALQKNSNTLLHDVDYNENSSERIDDLV